MTGVDMLMVSDLLDDTVQRDVLELCDGGNDTLHSCNAQLKTICHCCTYFFFFRSLS